MKTGRWLILVFWMLAGVYTVAAQEPQTGEAAPQSPAVSPGLFTSAQNALQSQDFERALLDISLYNWLNPTDSQGYYLRGIILANRGGEGDAERAIGSVDSAIRLAVGEMYTPDYRAALWSVRGEIFTQLEDVDAALESYEQSIQEQPTVNAYFTRAILYAQQQELDLALADIDAALPLTDDPMTQGSLYLLRSQINSFNGDAAATASDLYLYVQTNSAEPLEQPPLASDDVVNVEMAAGRVFAFPFEGAEGGQVSALAAPADGSQVDPLLVILDPDGEPLIGSDDASAEDFTALVRDIPLTKDGTYTLLVTHARGGDTGGVTVGIRLSE